MQKTIRWGIIGCGDVTEVKSGPGFQKATGSALVAVMRRDGAKAADYAKRHGVPRWYDDAARLISDPEVDAVYVATPPSSHKEYVLAAAAAGKPVYVEKPMARDHAECVAMVAACLTAGVPLFVAYYRRAMPRFLKVKELVDSGAIGTPRFVMVTLHQPPDENERDESYRPWRVVPEVAGAGRFLDLASHTLDILDFILGDITDAGGHAANQCGNHGAEDITAGWWAHRGGALGTGVWCFGAHDRVDRNEIVGSKGTLSFSTFGTEPPVVRTAQSTREHPAPTPEHVQQPLIQSIVDELLGKGKCPSTGENGARASWVMDRMLASWRANDE